MDMVVPIPLWQKPPKNTAATSAADVYKSELKTGKDKENSMVTTKTFKCRLFFAPFGEPTVTLSLGPVSSSFLLVNRRRGQGGCLFALDVNPNRPPEEDRPSPGTKRQRLAVEDSRKRKEECGRVHYLGRMARLAVRLLETDQGIRPLCALPPRITCGSLRSTVRAVYPALTPVQELSVKTAGKLESFCEYCDSNRKSKALENYKRDRFIPLDPPDIAHVERFKQALAVNVDRAWNRREFPYIPTGSSSLGHSRKQGGTWNDEPFSPACKVLAVGDGPKVRIVTVYSSYNSQVLGPLHQALYAMAGRKGWLLRGNPTSGDVRWLDGDESGPRGPYVSVDYKNATDGIRRDYCRAAVSVLKSRASDLTPEEEKCLDVVSELRLEGVDGVATTGQPMGSLISFPLLCLINKTVVDLALYDLAGKGEVSWRQVTSHRCLINGDDLMYREFTKSCGIRDGIRYHGTKVGLVLNEEKSLVDPEWVEVNSTPFYRGSLRKKTNVSVIRGDGEVSDPVGYISDCVRKAASVRLVVPAWRDLIKKAWPKVQGPVRTEHWRVLRQVCSLELSFRPSVTTSDTNPFPVVPLPYGYDLSRREEVAAINRQVTRLKSSGYVPVAPVTVTNGGDWVPVKGLRRRRRPAAEAKTLKVLADRWEEKKKENLVKEDEGLEAPMPIVSDLSKGLAMIDTIKAWKALNRGTPMRVSGEDVGDQRPDTGFETQYYIRFD